MNVKHHGVASSKEAKPAKRPRVEPIVSAMGLASPSAPDLSLGHRLRVLRDERDLSIRALADKSGLAMNTLSLIENGKTSPSVGTLQRVALALDVPIAAFFEIDSSPNAVAHVKVGRQRSVSIDHGTLQDLGAGFNPHTVEPFIVTLEPLAGSGSQICVHTGYEFVYGLEGRLAYTIEQSTYLLEPGDSLLFESHLPHRRQNVEQGVSRILLVLYPTDARDRPAEQHFRGGWRK